MHLILFQMYRIWSLDFGSDSRQWSRYWSSSSTGVRLIQEMALLQLPRQQGSQLGSNSGYCNLCWSVNSPWDLDWLKLYAGLILIKRQLEQRRWKRQQAVQQMWKSSSTGVQVSRGWNYFWRPRQQTSTLASTIGFATDAGSVTMLKAVDWYAGLFNSWSLDVDNW